MMPLVYIAGPFRGANAWVQEKNIRDAEELALKVWQLGCAVVCPHANTRFFQGAAPDEVWLEGDLKILSRCDAILMVPTWNRSQGARAELAFAMKEGIPDLYTLTSLAEWKENWVAAILAATQEKECP